MQPLRLLRLFLGVGVVALVLVAPAPARAQFGGGDAACPVDIDVVSLDASLGESCAAGRADVCESCLCDFGRRLLDAGYAIVGPDAVPFEACALANLATLSSRAGVTVAGLLRVANCRETPACLEDANDAVGTQPEPDPDPSADATTTTTTPTLAPGPTASDASRLPYRAAGGLELALAPPDVAVVDVVDDRDDHDDDDDDENALLASAIAAPVVLAALAAACAAAYVARAKRRARCLAKYVAAKAALAARGVVGDEAETRTRTRARSRSLAFASITCETKIKSVSAARDADADADADAAMPAEGRGSRVIAHTAAGETRAAPKVLLRDVAGACRRGEMLALLGPSGAGKSTLLRIISGRVDPEAGLKVSSGDVRVDGVVRTPRELRRAVAFVPQHDNLLPFLTVRESVMYSAELRLPWFISSEEKTAKTNAVLDELSLSHVANSRVGGAGGGGGGGGGGSALMSCLFQRANAKGGSRGKRSAGGGGGGGGGGVSGGERRRVTVGMELVTSPDIIVLDEPTSGLDASAAASMVFTLRALASPSRRDGDLGRVVVFSVHQPSPRAFRVMDKIMLLGVGGVVLWQGAPAVAEAEFAAIGFPCPVEDFTSTPSSDVASAAAADRDRKRILHHGSGKASPDAARRTYSVDISEWMLEVATCASMRVKLLASTSALGASARGTREEEHADVNENGSFASSVSSSAASSSGLGLDVVVVESHRLLDGKRKATPLSSPSSAVAAEATIEKLRRRSRMNESWVLLQRAARTTSRDPSLLLAHLFVATLTALLLGVIYLDSPLTLAGFQNRAGGMFFTLVFFGLASISAADRLSAEASIRSREIGSGYHGSGSYVLSSLAIDIAALRIPAVTVYSVIMYYMMGLRDDVDAFFVFFGVLQLFVAATTALCGFISIATSSSAVANLVCTFVLLLSSMFGGFLVSIGSVPSAIQWVQWASVYRYAWGAMLSNEMRDQTFLFDTTFEGSRIEVDVSGQTYLNTFGLHPKFITRDALGLFGIFALLVLASYGVLALRHGGRWWRPARRRR